MTRVLNLFGTGRPHRQPPGRVETCRNTTTVAGGDNQGHHVEDHRDHERDGDPQELLAALLPPEPLVVKQAHGLARLQDHHRAQSLEEQQRDRIGQGPHRRLVYQRHRYRRDQLEHHDEDYLQVLPLLLFRAPPQQALVRGGVRGGRPAAALR